MVFCAVEELFTDMLIGVEDVFGAHNLPSLPHGMPTMTKEHATCPVHENSDDDFVPMASSSPPKKKSRKASEPLSTNKPSATKDTKAIIEKVRTSTYHKRHQLTSPGHRYREYHACHCIGLDCRARTGEGARRIRRIFADV